MKLKIYKNLSDNKVVNKSITQLGNDCNGTLRDASSIIDPVITIDKFTGFNIAQANYAYIDEFDRYYYINDIVAITNDLYELHMHVDVLKSFASGIRSNTAVIGRQQQKANYDLLLGDGTFKVKANPHFNISKFPSGFSGHHYVLLVAGG